MERFSPAMLEVPVIAAPMAGGPSTPELAAAVTNAGGLGFIAAGLIPAELLAQRIAAARRLTSGPLGVNLFAPQPTTGSSAQFDVYASTLTDEAARYRILLGEPRHDDDDWAAKMDVIRDLRPDVVSFTFGLPTVYENKRLNSAGITSASTVTTLREAQLALACGADVLVAQGPSAGGHRATFDPVAEPAAEQLNELLAALVARVDAPIVAAGGLATSDDVHGALGAGAVAAQCGTAFLLADEAGTNPVHRAALQDPGFTETVLTRAFTGRYARGLHNRFIDDHEAQAPCGFPAVASMTSPIQAASVNAGDPHGTSLWAGTQFRQAMAGTTAAIMAALVP